MPYGNTLPGTAFAGNCRGGIQTQAIRENGPHVRQCFEEDRPEPISRKASRELIPGSQGAALVAVASPGLDELLGIVRGRCLTGPRTPANPIHERW